MLKEIFASIKSDKKMSLDHWRFRLLHWTAGLPRDGKYKTRRRGYQHFYPEFLYTHYCPLFHLTNLMLVFLPAIIFAKISWIFIKYFIFLLTGFARGCSVIFSYVCRVVAYIVSKLPERQKIYKKFIKKNEKLAAKAKKQKKPSNRFVYSTLAKLARKWEEYDQVDFDRLWRIEGWSEKYVKEKFGRTYKDLSSIWNAIKAKMEEDEKCRQAKTDARRRRIIKLVNISQFIIKFFLNIVYACLFAGVATITIVYGSTVFFGFIGYIAIVLGYIWSFNWLYTLKWAFISAICFVVTIAILTGIIFTLIVSFKKFMKTIPAFSKVFLPFVVVKDVSVGIGHKIGSWIVGIFEFIAMFYSENCPAIELVEDENE